MKAILGFAAGFIVARQVYLKYDKVEALEKEKKVKKRLGELLEERGLTKTEIKEKTKTILGK